MVAVSSVSVLNPGRFPHFNQTPGNQASGNYLRNSGPAAIPDPNQCISFGMKGGNKKLGMVFAGVLGALTFFSAGCQLPGPSPEPTAVPTAVPTPIPETLEQKFFSVVEPLNPIMDPPLNRAYMQRQLKEWSYTSSNGASYNYKVTSVNPDGTKNVLCSISSGVGDPSLGNLVMEPINNGFDLVHPNGIRERFENLGDMVKRSDIGLDGNVGVVRYLKKTATEGVVELFNQAQGGTLKQTWSNFIVRTAEEAKKLAKAVAESFNPKNIIEIGKDGLAFMKRVV